MKPSSKVHYGTPNGPACGARFYHEGLTALYNTEDVTCERCKRTAAWRHAERTPLARLSRGETK